MKIKFTRGTKLEQVGLRSFCTFSKIEGVIRFHLLVGLLGS